MGDEFAYGARFNGGMVVLEDDFDTWCVVVYCSADTQRRHTTNPTIPTIPTTPHLLTGSIRIGDFANVTDPRFGTSARTAFGGPEAMLRGSALWEASGQMCVCVCVFGSARPPSTDRPILIFGDPLTPSEHVHLPYYIAFERRARLRDPATPKTPGHGRPRHSTADNTANKLHPTYHLDLPGRT